jgi:Mg2+/citrate symporter
MRFKTFQGYVLVVLIGLLLIAGGILVILQWGNHTEFSAYGKNTTQNTAVLMLASVVAGMVLIPLVKVLIRGVRDINRGRRQESMDRVEKLDKQQQKATREAQKAAEKKQQARQDAQQSEG